MADFAFKPGSRSPNETHSIRHKGSGDYHVDNQEWSQVDSDPKMAIAYTERGAKSRAGKLRKYHEDKDWEAVPASPTSWGNAVPSTRKAK